MNNPHIKEGSVKYTKGYGWKYRVSKLLGLLVSLIPIILIAVMAFVYIKQPIKTEAGYVYPDVMFRNAKIGEEVVVIEESQTPWVFRPIENALVVQKPRLVTVIAGPYGEVVSKKDGAIAILSVDGLLETNLSDIENEYLEDEYIVRYGNEDELVSKASVIAKAIK